MTTTFLPRPVDGDGRPRGQRPIPEHAGHGGDRPPPGADPVAGLKTRATRGSCRRLAVGREACKHSHEKGRRRLRGVILNAPRAERLGSAACRPAPSSLASDFKTYTSERSGLGSRPVRRACRLDARHLHCRSCAWGRHCKDRVLFRVLST